jgi:membrane associated rhomboid family serine protease
MTSGADLFVVCKQCGSEVSPYITECPYCGSRLRRRAPKLPRVHAQRPPAGRSVRLGSLLGMSKRGGTRVRGEGSRPRGGRWGDSRPSATIALVAASCVAWVVLHAEPNVFSHMAVIGPLRGDWWKLFTTEFAYGGGVYAFVAILAVAIFGWLFERRHGPAAVLALFFGAGAVGVLAALAVYPFPIVVGCNGAALALVAAWAAPDLEAARAGSYYEGDLLAAAAIAALLLAIPFAGSGASWLAGVVGGVLGLTLGLGLHRLGEAEE